jgi:hypothetical protein
VHGKVKYVAVTVEQFDKMRMAELEVAYMLCKRISKMGITPLKLLMSIPKGCGT